MSVRVVAAGAGYQVQPRCAVAFPCAQLATSSALRAASNRATTGTGRARRRGYTAQARSRCPRCAGAEALPQHLLLGIAMDLE